MREDDGESHLMEFASQIQKLEGAVQGETRSREDKYEKIVKSVGDDLN